MTLLYLNDQFIDENDASIAITDRGLRFGDGIFETISFYNKQLYQAKSHQVRFENGLKTLKFNASIDVDEIFENAESLVHLNDITNGILKIVITRGDQSVGYLPTPNCAPTIIIHVMEKPKTHSKSLKLWLSEWAKPSANMLPVAAKTLQGLSSTLSKIEATEHECDEGLLLNADGYIAECSSSNIFWIINDRLYTPSLNCGILAGTTREAILRLSPFNICEGKFTIQNLAAADEIFISNTLMKAHPVTSVSTIDKQWETHDKTLEIRDLLKKDIAEQCNM